MVTETPQARTGNPRYLIALIASSLLVACLGVLGFGYIQGEGTWPYGVLTTVALIAASALAFAAGAYGISSAYARFAAREAAGPNGAAPQERSIAHKIAERLAPAWNVRHIAFSSALMLLLWLPWAVAVFPGVVGFDTYYQIYQCYPESHPITIILTTFFEDAPIDAYFTDHHPIFDTLVFGAFGMASDALTGNWNAGVAVYSGLQAVATALALTASIAYLREHGCPALLAITVYVFFCVAPFIPVAAFTMSKDSLFSLLYLPYFLMLFRMAESRGECLSVRRFVVLFIVIGVLLCVTKKTGMYIVVLTSLFAAIAYRQQWRPLLAQAGACLLVMLVLLPCVVFPLLNVAPGGKQEVLGVLFQQTAAYAQRHPAASDEKAAIDKVIDYRNARDVYVFGYHDYVKWLFKQDATTQDLLAYLKAWASMGARDPEVYLSALMGVAGRYVAPTSEVGINLGGYDVFFNDAKRFYTEDKEKGRPMVTYPAQLANYRSMLAEGYDAASHLPLLRWLFQTVLYALWLPAVAFFVMMRLRLRAGILLVPGVVGLLFCIIGPVFDPRYCLPLLYTTPLLMAALCCFARAGREKGRGGAEPAAA